MEVVTKSMFKVAEVVECVAFDDVGPWTRLFRYLQGQINVVDGLSKVLHIMRWQHTVLCSFFSSVQRTIEHDSIETNSLIL